MLRSLSRLNSSHGRMPILQRNKSLLHQFRRIPLPTRSPVEEI